MARSPYLSQPSARRHVLSRGAPLYHFSGAGRHVQLPSFSLHVGHSAIDIDQTQRANVFHTLKTLRFKAKWRSRCVFSLYFPCTPRQPTFAPLFVNALAQACK